MSDYRNNSNSPINDIVYWIITVVLLFSPLTIVGFIMLIRKLVAIGKGQRGRGYHYNNTYQQPGQQTDQQSSRQTGQQATGQQAGYHTGQQDRNRTTTPPSAQAKAQRTPPAHAGNGLIVCGIVLAAIFGIATAVALPLTLLESGLIALAYMSPVYGFLLTGVGMIYGGVQSRKKAKRFRKYLALIGRREELSVAALAQAMPIGVDKACEDLQEMLDRGYLPTGYLDWSKGKLILNGEGIEDILDKEEKKEEDSVLNLDDDNAVLNEIPMVNDAIADEEMSRKIDRVGEISGKIFAYQKQNPHKSSQMRKFLNYYLPATLKILRAYAQLEDQGIEGENIRAAKKRIEDMMDKVVEGFEKQLDCLFQDDVLDVTSDVEVLERMLSKDGLSGGGMTMGG